MPEMDGITASRVIKQELCEKAPYIIACTADLQNDTRAACTEAGMDNFLEKVRTNMYLFHRPQPEHSLTLLMSSYPPPADQVQKSDQRSECCHHSYSASS
jgi:CheY-like chemotaxis protein